jgi:esterase/lipase
MNDNLSQKILWTQEPQGQTKAIVVLLHGLNLKPEKMDDWARLLSDHQALIIRLSLYGHQGSYEEMRDVTAEKWQEQFKEAMHMAQEEAKKHAVPILFVGFSLGALVALESLSHEHWPINKMVLIAPALSIPWYSETAIKLLSVFGKGFMLPSRSPKQYQANKGTSVAAYQALFELKNSLEQNKYKNNNIDTLVLIDKNDELVSSKDIENIIDKNRLSLWALEIVDNNFAQKNYGFRHLMVDQEAMGKKLWDKVSKRVLGHLEL